ncbi:MAG: hypoxanthine phosphoribosyltransferase [Candidatus Eisenbacteria bacterium]|nr:hypoxanthine phosphoribosyltransferase [Candidatus Eisenbacteria bacterium]
MVTELLLTEEAVRNRVRELGEQISRDYHGRSLLLVGLLKGSILFLADLARAISLDVAVDFIAISSYQNRATSSGSVRLLRDLDQDVRGRDVLIVEDIVDSGLSLSYIRAMLLARGPRSLAIVALLDKQDRRSREVAIDYAGFPIPDRFVVGYGLDYQERYRGLRHIAMLTDAEIEQGERASGGGEAGPGGIGGAQR